MLGTSPPGLAGMAERCYGEWWSNGLCSNPNKICRKSTPVAVCVVCFWTFSMEQAIPFKPGVTDMG